MGVCNEERPVMHWQQSARYFGPPREQSPSLPGALGGPTSVNNNNHTLGPCVSCPDVCEHNTKLFGPSPIYNESCRSYDIPEPNVYNEPMHFITNSNRVLCTDVTTTNNNPHNRYQFKSEPNGSSSPESACETVNTPEDCAGCGRIIQDRFYLSAVEKRWHAGCLQCCICHQPLEGETSCFSRDENIYCKTDYHRVFGTRRCSRCLASISSSELVMRARHLVYHVRCFSCTVCNAPLTKGDQFGMRESDVFCRLHYEAGLDSPSGQQSNVPPISCQYPSQYGTSPNEPGSPSSGSSNMKVTTNGFFGTNSIGIPGLAQAPRQKGRPRKRKPKDIEALTANLDLSTEYLDLGFSRGGLGSSSRAKRMRTSFKHHQLRTMKSYFAINHNPDAKDLKQLSQKTGLPKRVLQVWFQNARAKWRRLVMKQEGKCSGSEKGDGPLDLDSYSSHSPPFPFGGVSPSAQSTD